MGFFQMKNRRYWTIPWDNPTKILRIIGPLEAETVPPKNLNTPDLFYPRI
jgi:hypothetical protein